jgi:hypothetical protein
MSPPLKRIRAETVVLQVAELACPVCYEVRPDLLVLEMCHHRLCQKCVDELAQDAETVCPRCRAEFDPKSCTPDVVVNEALASAECEAACGHTGTLAQHDAHVQSCLKCSRREVEDIGKESLGLARANRALLQQVHKANQRDADLRERLASAGLVVEDSSDSDSSDDTDSESDSEADASTALGTVTGSG